MVAAAEQHGSCSGQVILPRNLQQIRLTLQQFCMPTEMYDVCRNECGIFGYEMIFGSLLKICSARCIVAEYIWWMTYFVTPARSPSTAIRTTQSHFIGLTMCHCFLSYAGTWLMRTRLVCTGSISSGRNGSKTVGFQTGSMTFRYSLFIPFLTMKNTPLFKDTEWFFESIVKLGVSVYPLVFVLRTDGFQAFKFVCAEPSIDGSFDLFFVFRLGNFSYTFVYLENLLLPSTIRKNHRYMVGIIPAKDPRVTGGKGGEKGK
jgi:hypothetical protein